MSTHKLTVTVLALCVVVAGMGVVWQVDAVKTAQESVEAVPATTPDTPAPTPQASEHNLPGEPSQSSGTPNTSLRPRAREAEPAATGDPSVATTGSPTAATSDAQSGATTPPDYDDDGISDATDQCPTRPETVNGFQDRDGCPDVVKKTGAS